MAPDSVPGEAVKPDKLEVAISRLEAVGYCVGIVHTLSLLEGIKGAPGEEETVEGFIRRLLVHLAPCLKLDERLQFFFPADETLKTSLEERLNSDPHWFLTTYNRLVQVRKDRGLVMNPSKLIPLPVEPETAEDLEPVGKISGLENIHRLMAVLHVLSYIEEQKNLEVIPPEAFAYVFVRADETYHLERFLNVFLPASEMLEGAKTEGFSESLETRMVKETMCFATTYSRLVMASRELRPTLASWFVNDFFSTQVGGSVRTQIEKILHTLQNRLIARRQAVEKFEYHRLETIDENTRHLLDTLKQYGIEATSFEQARQEYERRYPPKQEPPQVKTDDELMIERELKIEKKVQKIGIKLDWEIVRQKMLKKHPPELHEYIQRSITKEREEEEGRFK